MRVKRGLSQQTVAGRCGSNYPYISELERGLKVPTLTMILRLASALECRVRDLVGVFDPYGVTRATVTLTDPDAYRLR